MTETKLRKIHIALPSTGEEECLAAREPILSGWLTQGPKVAEFEKNFAALHQVPHALAVTSCTTGLHLALAAMGVGPGDEVIVPSFTWIATANAVLYCGATPVLVDVDRETFNISVEDVKNKLSEKTKAIIPVHLFGLCADIDGLKAILPEHVLILEDAACAAGAVYKNRYAGGLGDMAAFSFHPRKSITTGEGGMVTIRDDKLADIANKMRNHGAEVSEEMRHKGSKPYLLPDFKMLGFNYRMTDLQAAVGVVQLTKLQRFIEERQVWVDYYNKHLADIEWLSLPKSPVDGQHAWQAYVTYVDPDKAPKPRNDIMDMLYSRGIATRPGTHAIHMLTFYRERFGYQDTDFPNALDCAQNSMAIPLHNKMCKDDFDYIIDELRNIK
jgi:dTDP-4-amino-4,6-dideoxygalactose transaminase